MRRLLTCLFILGLAGGLGACGRNSPPKPTPPPPGYVHAEPGKPGELVRPREGTTTESADRYPPGFPL